MRLIDADQAEKAIKEEANEEYCMENYSVFNGLKIAQQLVKDAETIDAVPVVRCGECIHRYGCGVCEVWKAYVEKDEYCKRGKNNDDQKR